MQLSDLLKRLTPAERKALAERRGLAATETNDAVLAQQLVDPYNINAVYPELNNGQLLLLTWLARQPGHEASFAELVAAVGERLPREVLERQLQDLRGWGLVDFRTGPGEGFVGSYPAACSRAPGSKLPPLMATLNTSSSEELRQMATALGISKPPGRKEERLRAIVELLSNPVSCRRAVMALPPEAGELFEWIREQGGLVSQAQLLDRLADPKIRNMAYYGRSAFWSDYYGLPEVLVNLVRRGLLLVAARADWASFGLAVPEEVELAYSGRTLFDLGPLTLPPLAQAGEVEGTVPGPLSVVRDLGHLLGFVASGRCEWRANGEPNKRSLTTLGKLLGNPDPEYVGLLWSVAVSAELLRRGRGNQQGYVAAKVEAENPEVLFDWVLGAWGNGASADESQLLRPMIASRRTRLLTLLQHIPPDCWLLKSSFQATLAFIWPLIFGSGHSLHTDAPTDLDWAGLQHLLIGTGRTPDGQEALTIPAAQQERLRGDELSTERALPPWERDWIVQPDRCVVVPPNIEPAALIELWKVAQLEGNQGAAVFRVTPGSVAAALNGGLKPPAVVKLLKQRSRTPVPETVERLITDQGARYGQIKVGSSQTYVRTEDPAQLRELIAQKKLGTLGLRELGPGVGVVEGHDAAQVLLVLRRAGYLPAPDTVEPAKEPSGQKAGPAEVARNNPATAANDPELLRWLQRAVKDGSPLAATWYDEDELVESVVKPQVLQHDRLVGRDLETKSKVMIPIESISRVERHRPGQR